MNDPRVSPARRLARMLLPATLRARGAVAWRRQRAGRTVLQVILKEWGYWQSLVKNLPVDRDGQPLPWYSYPAIHYLDSLDFSESRVLEWGAGFSTVFWGRRAKNVLTVEHDPVWANRISGDLDPLPVHLALLEEPQSYIDLAPSQALIQVDFNGMGPATWTTSTTSLFLHRDFTPIPGRGDLPGPSRAGLARDYDDHPVYGRESLEKGSLT